MFDSMAASHYVISEQYLLSSASDGRDNVFI